MSRMPMKKREAGFTLVEVVVAFTILLVLTTMAVPMARYQVRRQRERDLRVGLDDMRKAIDRYKDLCDKGKIKPNADSFCYPPSLEVLVNGVQLNNTISGGLSGSNNGKMRFLRRVPKDPMTGDTDWGKRSMQDEPTSSSWGGQNLFDVYSKSSDKASDGTPYAEW